MKLIDEWRLQLNKLWSVRITIFLTLLAGSDQILGLFQLYIPPVVYSLLGIAIVITRLVYQPKLYASVNT